MKFTLKWGDLLKGSLIAALTSAFVVIQQSLDAGNFIFNWKGIVMAFISGFLAYLTKNFFTDDVKQAKKVLNTNFIEEGPGGSTNPDPDGKPKP